MLACTIIARNYLAQARILANSFLREVPEGRMVALVLDADPEAADLAEEPFEIVTPTEVMDQREFGEMLAMYDVVELATAVKPWLLEHLLDQAGAVTYFDPDIELFSSPLFIDELARDHGLVLTPHATEPLPRGDDLTPGEDVILSAGIFNLGFVAVGGDIGRDVVRWWQSRLLRECVINPSSSRFVDQRWMDLTPGYFQPFILRHAGCNVAWWNLPYRRVTRENDSWWVNGEPLVFFHFSGYDPRAPHLVSKHQGRSPRVLLSERSDIQPLFAKYNEHMLEQGWAACSRVPYGLAQCEGLNLDSIVRRVARRAILDADVKAAEQPPNLIVDGATHFAAWLAEPTITSPGTAGVGRYVLELYLSRPDLQAEFPDVPGRDSARCLDHVRQVLVPQGVVQSRVLGPVSPDEIRDVPVADLTPGLNVIAYFTAESGVGQAARLILDGIQAAGIPHATVTYDRIPGRAGFRFTPGRDDAPGFDTNLICINADQILAANHWLGERLRSHRYRIGLWWWETETFPEEFDESFTVVDEVWVGSDFVAEAIRQRTHKPVTVIPMPVVVPEPNGMGRSAAGVTQDTFLVLYAFDFNSVLERKNPQAAIEAYRRAFSEDDGTTLLLKSINGDQHLEALEALRMDAAARRDIVFMDGYLDSVTNSSLIAECDCYLSLHRSEGFGLTIAEAMAYGRPVVATDYSANTEFMDDSTAFPVPVRMVPVPSTAEPYREGTLWGDPDVNAAATALRTVHDDPTEAERRSRAAADRIQRTRSPERAGAAIEERLAQIRKSRRNSRDKPADDALTPLDELASRLATSGKTPWKTSGVSAPAVAHRTLLRALRPYLSRRGEIDAVLLNILSTQEGALSGLEQRLSGLEQRLSGLERHLKEMSSAVQEHMDRLADDLSHVGRLAAHNDALLTTPMYLRDPDEFRLSGTQGVILGYEGAPADPDPTDAYRAFEEVFRGPDELITAMLADYPDLFPPGATVADIGCGRGEFLRLLTESGRTAVGVDQDAGMLAAAQAARTHEVVLGDGIAWLEGRPQGSLGGVFAAQFIEHLSQPDLLRFLRASHSALDPKSGVLVAETINPHFIPALRAFWVDLTHQSIIYPEVALAFARLVGFPAAKIVFPGGTGDYNLDSRAVGQFALVAARGSSLPASQPSE